VLAGEVRDALGRLPDDERQALALAYYGGYTQREVAAITGVPIGTVKSRMFSGVQRLRRLLMPLQLETAELFGSSR
jgi:RNA polymerase sigma factor (sigma-70 family)